MTDKLLHLKEKVRAFADARDWDQFHSPKNLAMALIVEAAELVEHFQWLTEEQSAGLPDKTRQEVEAEMADILIYLVRIADKLDIDLYTAAVQKLEHNAEKYPVDKVRGLSKKYNEY
ncbi:MAG TPA: nucleotide pyrophosphohydrolase [Gammaproteobacteria bacterium]|nr:nucleotide pyrophosphohydrolase [Gammaproteobacteria bacterium]